MANDKWWYDGRPITRRDREILIALATTRYLTSEQIGTLFFPGRSVQALNRRLRKLSEEQDTKAYIEPAIRKVTFRNYWGDGLVTVWTPMERGYTIAEAWSRQAFAREGRDVGADFLEHATATAELFVQLAKRDDGTPAHVSWLPFKWDTEPQYPFFEYDMAISKTRDRWLKPDAVVSVPAAKKRFFIEYETGSHSLSKRLDDRGGSTVNKVRRYEKFFCGLADAGTGLTHHGKVFPDAFHPVLVLAMQSDGRRAKAQQVLNEHQRLRDRRVDLRIASMDEVAALIHKDLPPARSAAHADVVPSSELSVDKDFARTLLGFFNESVGRIQEQRTRERLATGEPATKYPTGTEQIRKFLQNLGQTGAL
jgi:hypothetical protein